MAQVTPHFVLNYDSHIFGSFYLRAISLYFFCSCSLLLFFIIYVDGIGTVTSWIVSVYHSLVHLLLLSLFKSRQVLIFCKFWLLNFRWILSLVCKNVILPLILVEIAFFCRSCVFLVKFTLFIILLSDFLRIFLPILLWVLTRYCMSRVELSFWVRKITVHSTLRHSESIFFLIRVGEVHIIFRFSVKSSPRVIALIIFIKRQDLILSFFFFKNSHIIKSFGLIIAKLFLKFRFFLIIRLILVYLRFQIIWLLVGLIFIIFLGVFFRILFFLIIRIIAFFWVFIRNFIFL